MNRTNLLHSTARNMGVPLEALVRSSVNNKTMSFVNRNLSDNILASVSVEIWDKANSALKAGISKPVA